MSKYLVIWPKSANVVHINYHYTQFGEYIDYLNNKLSGKVKALDLDVADENLIEYIKNNEISKIAVQVNYENSKNSFETINTIKENFNIPVMAYGNIARMFPDLFSKLPVDMIINDGDDEKCIETFFKYYDNSKLVSEFSNNIKGGKIIQDGKFIPTAKGEYVDSNEWGYSKSEFVPIYDYDRIKGKNRYILNISRGCPFACSHCLIQMTEGKTERRRSVENVDKAISDISKEYKHIKIWAANFTLDKKYVDDFCNMMIKNHPDITWECATRIELVKDNKMLEKMNQAGCKQITLGIESLNNKELIHTKNFKIEDIDRAINNINNNNMVVKGCIMLGMPNQSKQDIINTLEFLNERNVVIRPTIYTPYQLLDKHINVDELSKYNRKTLENENVEGVSSKQLLELVKNPYDYKKILDLNREERKSCNEILSK